MDALEMVDDVEYLRKLHRVKGWIARRIARELATVEHMEDQYLHAIREMREAEREIRQRDDPER